MQSNDRPTEDRPLGRRRFFREGLRELLRPLANVVEPLEQALKQMELTAQESPRAASSARREVSLQLWLRPPGALHPDNSFRDTCSRCRKCIEVCPAQCIRIDPSGARGEGAPFIDADMMPCVLCDSLACMNHCPSGALQLVPLEQIDMGTAIWNEHTCLRSHGEECTICIDKCPVGQMAIELRQGKVHVHEDGCTGCGVCQFECPTSPKSIRVAPAHWK